MAHTRSKLTDKFKRKNWEDSEREFKKKYKEEEGKAFKGSVVQYVTIGVIQRKGLPDVEDVTYLMKRALLKNTDEEIDDRLSAYFEDENNKARGYAGAFCEVCKDLTLDIPIHPQITEAIMNMEDLINKRLDAMNQLSEMLEKLGNLTNTLKSNDDKKEETTDKKEEELGVDNKDTQEDK